MVQYFEAALLEWHEERDGDPSFPELPMQDKVRRMIQPVDLGNTYTSAHGIAAGRHNIGDSFKSFYKGGQGEWRLGQAITEELQEEVDAQLTTVQYFEKGKLEINPVNGAIQYGRLGEWAFDIQCRYGE
ncbi:MAG: hypothetical protein HC837_05360 [Chloroflexaceae bacterium]|nr:hypothetical protein [Chloroflexaceae bacterium]